MSGITRALDERVLGCHVLKGMAERREQYRLERTDHGINVVLDARRLSRIQFNSIQC